MDTGGTAMDIVHLLRETTTELALTHGEFARANGLHTTDVRALVCLLDGERTGTPLTPGELGTRLGLNSAGTTAVIDRLERAGYVGRLRDARDRRRVRLQVSEQAVALGRRHFGPLIARALDLLEGFEESEVLAVRRFLCGMRDAARSSRS
ncbi:MarR family transcriptional regulator [Streptomyces sp. NPDC050703]|uniref:MarR family transcriptional regulator n=1 Tax=Streptomyces sp. NPDC050703 TaxID=3157218 RepID=UPI003439997D